MRQFNIIVHPTAPSMFLQMFMDVVFLVVRCTFTTSPLAVMKYFCKLSDFSSVSFLTEYATFELDIACFA